MVIPGVSGSMMLMLLGYYYPIIDNIKALPSEENEQDIMLQQEFEMNYTLRPLKLIETDVISDIPELPVPLVL